MLLFPKVPSIFDAILLKESERLAKISLITMGNKFQQVERRMFTKLFESWVKQSIFGLQTVSWFLGEEGQCMYILNKGTVEIRIDNMVVSNLESGAVFGEMAVLGKLYPICITLALTVYSTTSWYISKGFIYFVLFRWNYFRTRRESAAMRSIKWMPLFNILRVNPWQCNERLSVPGMDNWKIEFFLLLKCSVTVLQEAPILPILETYAWQLWKLYLSVTAECWSATGRIWRYREVKNGKYLWYIWRIFIFVFALKLLQL